MLLLSLARILHVFLKHINFETSTFNTVFTALLDRVITAESEVGGSNPFEDRTSALGVSYKIGWQLGR